MAELIDCSFEEYLKLDAVQRSALEDFLGRDGEELYYGKYVARNIADKTTKAKDIGSVFHDLVLGTDTAKCVVIPDHILSKSGRRAGKKWDDFRDEHEGCVLITQDEYQEVEKMVLACREHPQVGFLLEHPRRVIEHVILWDDVTCNLRRKCRPDLMIPGEILVDLKTYTVSQLQSFERHCYKFGYHRQAAFYRDGHRALYGRDARFLFVAIRKDPPYSVRTWEIEGGYLALGHDDVQRGLERLAQCYRSGQWRKEKWYEAQLLHLPPWAIPAEDMT